MIRVLVIDENDSYREDFCKILRKHSFEVVLSTNRRDTTNNAICTAVADLAIIDFKTTKPETLLIAKKVKEHCPEMKLIFHCSVFPQYMAGQLFKLGDGLIIKQYYDVEKGFYLIDQVLHNTIKVFGDKQTIARRTFWILGRPYPEHQYLLSDKAVESAKNKPAVISLLMNVFSRGQPVIEEWLKTKDIRLLSPQSIDCISQSCNLSVAEIMEEVNGGVFQVMV